MLSDGKPRMTLAKMGSLNAEAKEEGRRAEQTCVTTKGTAFAD